MENGDLLTIFPFFLQQWHIDWFMFFLFCVFFFFGLSVRSIVQPTLIYFWFFRYLFVYLVSSVCLFTIHPPFLRTMSNRRFMRPSFVYNYKWLDIWQTSDYCRSPVKYVFPSPELGIFFSVMLFERVHSGD